MMLILFVLKKKIAAEVPRLGAVTRNIRYTSTIRTGLGQAPSQLTYSSCVDRIFFTLKIPSGTIPSM